MMQKILLIGSTPPPIGGVTIHIDRFIHLYGEEYGFDIAVLDLKKRVLFQGQRVTKNIFGIISFFLSSKIIHIHISNDSIKLFFAAASKMLFKKVIYTHHNSIVKNAIIFKLMYYLCDKVILVNNQEIDKNLIDYQKTEVIPAFLPPYKLEPLPNKIEKMLSNYQTVISTNCSLYNFIDGKHVYGFDLMVDAFYGLSKNKKIKHTLLILVDPSNTTGEFVSKLLKDKEFGTNKVLYTTQKLDFASLIKKTDITVRATRTDGDSLSIRESLYFNTPIIASDVTARPEGTITFKSDNSMDLENKILEILKNKQEVKYEHINYGQKVLDLYGEVLKMKKRSSFKQMYKDG
jgi:glycosyltransferase involved in cell wall biosynthesis